MDEPPSPFHNSLSRLKLHFTNNTVTIAIMAEHKYGRLHPTPNATFSGSSITKTVVAIAIIRKPVPQHQLNVAIILRNMLLASYLRVICALKAFSHFISFAMKSSTIL